MANQILIIGNWKMNPQTLDEAKKRFQSIKKTAAAHPSLDVVICPPFPYIGALAGLAANGAVASTGGSKSKGKIAIGAQDASLFDAGSAQTGDVGATMLESTGASYIILGHSERRAQGDTSSDISKKIQQALKTSMKIVICFGEKVRDADGGYLEIIKEQLKEVLAAVNRKQFQQIILAYEPVWAVGRPSNEADTSHDVHQMVIYIRKCLREMFDATISSMVPILYGGSANPANVEDMIFNGEVDGLLVGRASWQADTFSAMLNAINGGDKAKNKKNLKETLIMVKNNKQKRYNERIQEKKEWKRKNEKKAVKETVKKAEKKTAKKAVKKVSTKHPKKASKFSKKSPKFTKKHSVKRPVKRNAKRNKKTIRSKARRSKR